MKKPIQPLGLLVILYYLASSAHAQTFVSQVILLDQEMVNETIELAQKDFDIRHAGIAALDVTWYNSDFGYYGKYAIHGMEFITRYNSDGEYVTTLCKKDWKKTAPELVKRSFINSDYRDQLIVGYWEVVEITAPLYLVELKDHDGNFTRIWLDNRGNFATVPYQRR